MHIFLLRLSEVLILLFVLSGFLTIITTATGNQKWQRVHVIAIPVLAIILMFTYWYAQTGYRENDAVFWSRMMAGDGSKLLSFASLGLILSGGFALAAMSLGNRFTDLLIGAVCFVALWVIIYWHPTPHYVPLTETQDNIVWLALLAGAAAVCILIYIFLQKYLKSLRPIAAVLAGLTAMMPLTLVFAHVRTLTPVNLRPLSDVERIQTMGCLSCHTMNGMGQEVPGGAIESVASRNEDVVLAFMLEPTAEKAEELKIRSEATGEMAGVKLTEEEAKLLTEAMAGLFEVKPPTMLGPGNEHIETLLTQNNCLACHSVKGEGAPEGGLGKALEYAADRPYDIIVEWMMDPSREKAIELGIRGEMEAIGAMDGLALNREDAEAFAEWVRTLDPPKEE